MSRFPNVALTGLARSGKDTAGRLLVEGYGYHRVSFADNVRRVALAIDPYIGRHLPSGEPERLSTTVDAYGWDSAKSIPEVRRLLQVIGTEAGRDIFGVDHWTNLALGAVEGIAAPLVFTDVRFGNEALAARKRGQIDGRGTIVVRLTRSEGNETLANGLGGHASEAGVATMLVDYEVTNNGTVKDLDAKFHNLITEGQ